MKKILIGIGIAIIVAVAGFFGYRWYMIKTFEFPEPVKTEQGEVLPNTEKIFEELPPFVTPEDIMKRDADRLFEASKK